MKKKATACLALALTLLLCGCSSLLERSYSSTKPHSATYWESGVEDTLRADSYQDMVNALLLLVNEHADQGVVRLYEQEPGEDMDILSERACNEVQHETPMGSYLLDYITYSGTDEHDYYELRVQFGYRRSEEQQAQIIGTTSSEAITELLRQTYEQGQKHLAVRVSYFAHDRAGVEEMVLVTQRELLALPEEEELPEEARWSVTFYPDNDNMGIVEIVLEGAATE